VTFSRRTLLGSGAATVATTYLASLKSTPVGRYLDGVSARLVDGLPSPDATNVSTVSISAERDSDLLLLDFNFYGFKLDTSSTPVSIVPTIAAPLIFVNFPPQAIGEGVYPQTKLPPPPSKLDSPPTLSVISGPSELVFSFPATSSIPLKTMTFDDILDWSSWTLLVDEVAVMGATVNGAHPLPTFPSGDVSLIECPYGLYLSPVVNPKVSRSLNSSTSYVTSFAGTVQPATTDRVTECWTATLTYALVTSVFADQPMITRPGTTVSPLEPKVSAVWCRDLSMYADFSGTRVDTWVPWAKLDNPKYFATPMPPDKTPMLPASE